ncbi:ATP-binding protein [Achromobacter mucicolens]|uniref:ATP-binding protein n=1 Tax=Achromobacter mucicolens TaxID=1389922 RepID=UPI0024486F83|nr:ATP-binding protein [Achromobacter mucicolens]MDH0093459.1 ATP-binding protein [Achromobacter mucicolens]
MLHFDVSSGLKSVLGGELITNDEVAIFELVKNSFDAAASRVDIYFDDETIVVADNGSGMSQADIQEKWLFVAYSAKRVRQDFRDEISDRRRYAGSKGIGRFSSDRLGKIVVLQTRPKEDAAGPVHAVRVDWGRFDANHLERFETIPVQYVKKNTGFGLPGGIPPVKHGTSISIEQLRKTWTRDDILRLKSALSKLINPFGAESDGFKIIIHAPKQEEADSQSIANFKKKEEEASPNALANGPVGNFIFSTLQQKTTFIDVKITESGQIESTLTDRGSLIYRIREPNEFPLLADSGFCAKVFFLNTSAKMTFAKRMGVPSVQFGSIFLFRNGFRVFPIGEDGDDWFGIDRRKQQGYSRFLGTRELIGRIDVFGTDEHFQEASSRDSGLIATPAVLQLRRCVQEHCLKRLERYVIPVTFVDKEDRHTSDVSRLLTDPGRARVTSAVAKLVDNDEVELLDYNRELIGILDERSSQFEASLGGLRAIAEKTEDKKLFASIENAEKRFAELRKAEELARIQADEEREAKEAAERRASAAEAHASKATFQLEEEKKRNLFLTSIASLDTATILNLHHQVTMYAVDINQQIENFLVKVSSQHVTQRSDILSAIERISLLNKKIMGISKFATKANFRLESEHITADLGDYIEQYINGVAKDFLFGPLRVSVQTDGKGFEHKFKPIDVSVIIDNLIANAKKAKANQINFSITHPDKGLIHIGVTDNGRGFAEIIESPERVFEKGFSTTDGSGLGLYHVRMVLGEMNGTITAEKGPGGKGANFQIRISR